MTVDLVYVADKLMRITDASDKDLRKEIEEFREECLRNIGVDVVNEYNNQEKEMSMRFKDWVITMQEDAENMNYVEFISKYGVANIDIWRDYHDPNYENTNVDEYMSEGCP